MPLTDRPLWEAVLLPTFIALAVLLIVLDVLGGRTLDLAPRDLDNLDLSSLHQKEDELRHLLNDAGTALHSLRSMEEEMKAGLAQRDFPEITEEFWTASDRYREKCACGVPSKPIELAIVVPFVATQIQKLVRNIRLWDKPDTFACGMDSSRNARDVYFYYNIDIEDQDASDLRETIDFEMTHSMAKHCFRHVRFISAYLNEHRDANYRTASDNFFGSGPQKMFYMLFDMPQIRDNYDYFFLMEPDAWPIRTFWADIISQEAGLGDGAWIIGTLPRGDEGLDASYREHINGNALWKVGDAKFRHWMESVRCNYPPPESVSDPVNPFDLAVYWHWETSMEFFTGSGTLVSNECPKIDASSLSPHLWRYATFVESYHKAEYNVPQILHRDPLACVVHADQSPVFRPSQAPPVEGKPAMPWWS